MIRQNQWTRAADPQPVTHRHAIPFKLIHFGKQRGRREHHTIAEQAHDIGTKDARRDQVQHPFLAVDDQRVAGVMSALKPNHRIGPIG